MSPYQSSQAVGGLDELLPFVFPTGRGVVAVFGGYFDESERPEGSEPICLAGFIFKPGQYKRFRQYWQSNVLRYRGRRFSAFHMTDLASGRKEYEGLTIPERLDILDHAVSAIETNATAGVAVYFAQTEFEQKAPPEWADVFGSIYTVACGMCLQVTGYWLAQWGHQMNVMYVFESGHKFRSQADEFLTAYGRDARMRERARYRAHLFDLKAEPGLQAADLSAWSISKVMLIEENKIPNSFRPFVKPIKRLAHCLGDRYIVYPFEGDLLDQFLSDILSQPVTVFPRRGKHPDGLR